MFHCLSDESFPCSSFPRPNLKTLRGDSQELSTAIARASGLAESVSSKVRVLDLAKVSQGGKKKCSCIVVGFACMVTNAEGISL